MSIVSGNLQTGVVGTALEKPLQVGAGPEHSSMFCTGLGHTFAWSVESGGGSISLAPPTPPLPASTGVVIWTLGPTPGRQTVRATWTSSGQATAPSVIFEATAVNAQ